MNERKEGEEKPVWVDQDMTGKPLEEVIEYQVKASDSRAQYSRRMTCRDHYLHHTNPILSLFA